jgi:hypothetical protein
LAAADAANGLLIRSAGVPHMDAHRNVSGPTIDWLLRWIDSLLECEEADRRDLGL